jgi:hypothetical protein
MSFNIIIIILLVLIVVFCLIKYVKSTKNPEFDDKIES